MKYKKFKLLNLLQRKRNPINSRVNKIRLEKNERVSNYNNKFLNKIRKSLLSENISAYPEVEEIYSLLAKHLSVSPDMLVITAGSDLAIKNCFELLISPGDEVITLNPTYGMVDIYSKLFQAKQKKINFDKNLNLDQKKLFKSINEKTNLVILANPNSPTGTIIDEKILLIQKWSDDGLIAAVHPYHLIFSIWSLTQHYSDFDVQVRAVLTNEEPYENAEVYLHGLFTKLLKPY